MYKIAEIGINHNGDLELAKKMIIDSKEAGFDCVKFQKRNVEKNLDKTQLNTFRETPYGKLSYIDWKKVLEFGQQEYKEIDKLCRKIGIDWSASVWDTDSVEFISQFDIPFIKIPSARFSNKGIIEAVKKTGKNVIASTGMSNRSDVFYLYNELRTQLICVMYCRSVYPTEFQHVNLQTLIKYNELFISRQYNSVGYSSHDMDELPILLAASMANHLELHITESKQLYGSDQAISWELKDIPKLFAKIDDVKTIMGKYIPKIIEAEIPAMKKLKI